MAQWQFTLDLQKEYQQYEAAEITMAELSKVIAEKLRLMRHEVFKKYRDESYVYDLDEIIDSFEDFAETKDDDVKLFDHNMEDLYDWGDTRLDNKFGGKAMCWIGASFI